MNFDMLKGMLRIYQNKIYQKKKKKKKKNTWRNNCICDFVLRVFKWQMDLSSGFRQLWKINYDKWQPQIKLCVQKLIFNCLSAISQVDAVDLNLLVTKIDITALLMLHNSPNIYGDA